MEFLRSIPGHLRKHFFYRPVVVKRTLVRKTTVENVNNEEKKQFDILCKKVSDLCREFRDNFKGTDKEFEYHITFKSIDQKLESHSLTCPWCGKRNRTSKGMEGARCGSCKNPLSKPKTMEN